MDQVDLAHERGAGLWWLKLALLESTKAANLEAQGLFSGVARCRATLYTDTARAVRMTVRTGIHHCTHFVPSATCPACHPQRRR